MWEHYNSRHLMSPTFTGYIFSRQQPPTLYMATDSPRSGHVTSDYRRKLAEGKSRKEALRCLKRRLSDAVYRQLLADQHRLLQAQA
jgi:hypothetical protein